MLRCRKSSNWRRDWTMCLLLSNQSRHSTEQKNTTKTFSTSKELVLEDGSDKISYLSLVAVSRQFRLVRMIGFSE
jgi:hypothetical protein